MGRMMSMITAAGLGAAAMTMMNRRTRSRMTDMAKSMVSGQTNGNQVTDQMADNMTNMVNNATQD